MAKPVRYDFDIYAERTLRKKWRWYNPRNEDGSLGDPMNITGWHFRLVVPADGDDDFLVMSDTVDDNFPEDVSINITDAPAGKFEWFIPDEVSSVLDFEAARRDYFFDYMDLSGDWFPSMRGVVRLWKVR